MIFRRRNRKVPGLNTASTADISFMLLIFFLVTTSMDVDKGLVRMLPSPEPQKREDLTSTVDKATLMALHVTADNQLLLNDKPFQVSRLQQEVVAFVHRLGKRHLISVVADRDANYDLYFQMQNQLMSAYNQIRNEYAEKHFGKPFSSLANKQKDEVRKACPQRITESYANALLHEDKRVDANAEEQEEGETSQQQKGGGV